MKIEFIPLAALSTPVILAEDNSVRLNPRDLKKQASAPAQPLEAIGAPQFNQFPRDNTKTQISFKVIRRFATLADSLEWWLDSSSILNIKGVLKLTQDTTIRYLPNTIINAVSDQPQGIIVHINYTITGGKITSEDPTS